MFFTITSKKRIKLFYHTIKYVKEGLNSLVHKRIDVPVLGH